MTDAEARALLQRIKLYKTRVRVRARTSVVEGIVAECGEYLSGPGLRIAYVPAWFYLTNRAREVATVEIMPDKQLEPEVLKP